MVSKKNIYKTAVGILALSLAVLSIPLSSAFGETGFRAGNIISDANMYQATPSMSAAEIQKFLNTQGAACRGNGCLKNIRLNTRSFNADPYCKGKYQGANNEPVSQVIYKISQACQINPKVLLVTIQKEQAGITQNLTTAKQNKLTGYGCPDGRPCSEQYYGVQNQIYQAAHQFQRYRIKSTNYSFRSGITANIQFSYQSGCGSSKVKLENQATASLYNYTPYQPNQALLSGNPDRCSSDGNYNFFKIYQRWFGDPRSTVSAVTPSEKVAVPQSGYTGTSNNTKAQSTKEQVASAPATGSNANAAQKVGLASSRSSNTATTANSQASTSPQLASNSKPVDSSQAAKDAAAQNAAVKAAEQEKAQQEAKAATQAAQQAAKAAEAKKAAAAAEQARTAAAAQKEKPTQPSSDSQTAKSQSEASAQPQPTTATPATTMPAKAATESATSSNSPALATTGTIGGSATILAMVLVIAGWRIRKNVIDNRPIRVNC
ncbi:hypothetical protein [uncultured Varibaculum sp.]|uniref:hypothetical protein n=1 Tax=uncultured Varibaculum sp. TaxID=413896 RepID=UPI0025876378|nr:hypothetical protein [uncultured Varibaculum sp.]